MPAELPVFGHDALPADEVVMLAHLVGAPGSDKAGPRLWTDNREVAIDAEHRGTRFGVTVTDRTLPDGGRTWDIDAGPALGELAARHEVAAAVTDRRVPPAVFRLPRDLLARFLNRLLGLTVTIWQPAPGDAGGLVVSVRSGALAADLAHLLLRFGVVASRRETVVAIDEATWVAHEVVVDQPAALVALADHVGVLGHEAALGTLVASARRAVSTADRRVLTGPTGARPGRRRRRRRPARAGDRRPRRPSCGTRSSPSSPRVTSRSTT